MEEKDVLFGLHEIEGVGWDTISEIAAAVPDLALLLKEPASELLAGTKVPRNKAKRIEAALTNEFIAGKLNFYERLGITPVSRFDPRYPPLLAYGVEKPPWVLYAMGDVSLLGKTCIAVVGTRSPTAYGREAAEWFGAELAAADLPVVSGLAYGIDSYAHAGALRTSGATIAVLGNGLHVYYPREHRELQREIARRGLVISEFSLNARPTELTFPRRNRLIAGIARAVVVVEAAARSGSLHTAGIARNAGRDVFAVPGPVTSPKSAGTLALLKDGALLASAPQDIMEEYGISSSAVRRAQQEGLTPDERELLAAVGGEAVTIDELIARTGRNFGHLHNVLLSLLVKRRVRTLPGSRYIARMN